MPNIPSSLDITIEGVPSTISVAIGTPGAQGPAATIAVGTTTTLSPGAAASPTSITSTNRCPR